MVEHNIFAANATEVIRDESALIERIRAGEKALF